MSDEIEAEKKTVTGYRCTICKSDAFKLISSNRNFILECIKCKKPNLIAINFTIKQMEYED